MGGLFKHKSSKSTTTENTSTQNLLAQNKDFMNTFNAANKEMANANPMQVQIAGYSQDFLNAQAALFKGVDTSYLQQAQSYLTDMGQSNLNTGQSALTNAQGILSRIAGMTTEDYQKGFQSEYNSALVQEQIAAATTDINQQRDEQVQALNQNASASGAMGSSRAGVAQGVIAGKALNAVGQASIQYRTQEEQLAQSRYMGYLQNQQASAGSLANIAGQQISLGMNAYTQGISYGAQRQQNIMQNAQNAYNAGISQQQIAQNQLNAQQQNAWMAANPALARLQQYGGILSPFGNAGSIGNKTTTTVTPAQGNGMMGGIMGAVGGIAGAYFGGPMGAQLGASIGGSIGSSM